ncbi:MAG: PH domain-containing protein [Planctomycetes bacterium]|nr:PH domain-containing protein [Planctomycetota bacterium]
MESEFEIEPEPTAGASTSSVDANALERLDPRVVLYWLIAGIIEWIVLAGLATVAVWMFREKLPADWSFVLYGGFVLFGLMLVWNLVRPTLAYRRWRFSIGDELMLMRYGIIYHEEKAIPISRLQHVDLTRGPVERLFGLATLVVFTAGTEAASFRLPGLAVLRAEELRDRILVARGDDVI